MGALNTVACNSEGAEAFGGGAEGGAGAGDFGGAAEGAGGEVGDLGGVFVDVATFGGLGGEAPRRTRTGRAGKLRLRPGRGGMEEFPVN